MFCPNCGANNSTEQKFCRSCGLNLEKTAESLTEQMPSAESANLMRREKSIERFGNFALGGLGVVGLIAIIAGLWFLVTNLLLNGKYIVAAILLIAFIVFATLSLIFVVFNETLKEKKQKINPGLDNELTGARNTAKLLEEQRFEPIPSVTENSTELISVENRTRKVK